MDVGLIVTNTGGRTASEVAQFYLSDLEASTLIPLQKLIDFERVTPKPGESQTLEFTITPEIMSFFNEDGMLTLEPGEFRLEVGSCSPGKRGQELDVPAPVTAVFKVI